MSLLDMNTLWTNKMLAKTDSQSRAKVRSNPVPMDYSSIFQSKSAAITYATTDPTAYPGQVIAVAENEFSDWTCNETTPSFTIEETTVKFSNGVTKTAIASTDEADKAGEEGHKESLKLTLTVKTGDLAVPAVPGTGDDVELTFTRTYGQTQNVYVLDNNAENNLKKISGGSSTGAASGDVEAETARAMAKENALSGEIDQLSANVYTQLSVTVEKQTEAEEGYLATYVIKQGGEQVGASINIPKDFLVKKAEVKVADAAFATSGKITGIAEGEKYIDFTVNTADTAEGSATDTHLYIRFNDILIPYTFKKTDTIEFTVDAQNNVSADVIDASIVTAKLADSAVTTAKIKDGNVTTDKIADGNVTTAKIADKAVTNDKLALSSVTMDRLSSDVREFIENQSADALSAAKLYTDEQISALDFTQLDLSSNETIKFVKQEDGKVTAEKQDIEIEQSQVQNLTSDLDDIRLSVDTMSSHIAVSVDNLEVKTNSMSSATALSVAEMSSAVALSVDQLCLAISSVGENYLTKETFNAISTTIGLDAATADNKVLTLSDLNGIKLSVDTMSSHIAVSVDNLETKTNSMSSATALSVAEMSAATALSVDQISNVVKLSVEQLVKEIDSGLSDLELSVATMSSHIALSVDTMSAHTAVSVDNLRTDVDTMSSHIALSVDQISTAVALSVAEMSATADAKFLTKETFDAISCVTGLSAANAENPVVTKKDIADLAGAMHFVGAVEAEITDEMTLDEIKAAEIAALEARFDDPVAGDVAIITGSSREYVYANNTWYELGDEGIYMTKAEFETWKTATFEPWQVSVELSVAEMSAAVALSVDQISAAVHNKVKVGNYGQALTAVDELSVVHIGADEYHQLVKDEKVDETTIYVVSADNLNAYGERVTNVGTAVSASDAVNLSVMENAINAVSAALSTDYMEKLDELSSNALSGVSINGVKAEVEDNVAVFSLSCICGGNASTEDNA